MNKKGIELLKYIGFLAVLMLTIFGAYKVLKWKDTTGGYLSSIEQLYATDEQLMDVVFVGSSHVYQGIYPALLWQEAGIASFNLSVAGQDKNSAYYQLKELYKSQNPQVVYVDYYATLFERHTVKSNEYRNYMSMDLSPNAIEHIKSYVDEEEQADFLLRFPIIHTRYSELEKYDFVPYAPNRFGRGAFYSWNVERVYPDEHTDAITEEIPISEANREWVDSLAELTKEHGSKLVFVLLPFAMEEQHRKLLNGVGSYIQKLGYSCHDFNRMRKELGIDPDNDFSDRLHLNAYGAAKVTTFLKDDILNACQVTDHRADERYEQWNQDLSWYQALEIEANLENATPNEYVHRIQEYTDAITVISLEGNFYEADIDYFELLAPLGMDYDEYLEGGKWIYKDGALIKLCSNVEGSEAVYDLGGDEPLRLSYFGEFDTNNIRVGYRGYQSSDCLTFVEYNTLLMEVTSTKSF